ncbi:MAG: hypothetical protein ISN26_03055, partial [Betaproteobacteria bacterium AqS2]|nr:hypothetical protein [Betaproteobacteria bacterium AqS2]
GLRGGPYTVDGADGEAQYGAWRPDVDVPAKERHSAWPDLSEIPALWRLPEDEKSGEDPAAEGRTAP